MTVGSPNRTAIQFQQLEELAKACFLVAPQVPWLGTHAFNHARGLIPVAVDARSLEILARSRSRTMGRNDRGNDRRQLVDNLHGSTSLEPLHECAWKVLSTPFGSLAAVAELPAPTTRHLRRRDSTYTHHRGTAYNVVWRFRMPER
jgi:hypothetical protein